MKYDLFVLQMKMLKSYYEHKEDLEKEIEDLIYQYCGVKGIPFDKELSISNPYSNDEKLVDLSEKLEEPQKQLDFTIYAISKLKPIVYGNLDKLPADVSKALIMKHWENKTFEDIANEIGYSKSGLWFRVRREIGKI